MSDKADKVTVISNHSHIAHAPANTCMLALCPMFFDFVNRYASSTPGIARMLTMISSYAGAMLRSDMKNFGKTYVRPNTLKSFVKWQKNRNTVIE